MQHPETADTNWLPYELTQYARTAQKEENQNSAQYIHFLTRIPLGSPGQSRNLIFPHMAKLTLLM
jgi:hypothetical protein